jgi:hypothetical protein
MAQVVSARGSDMTATVRRPSRDSLHRRQEPYTIRNVPKLCILPFARLNRSLIMAAWPETVLSSAR